MNLLCLRITDFLWDANSAIFSFKNANSPSFSSFESFFLSDEETAFRISF